MTPLGFEEVRRKLASMQCPYCKKACPFELALFQGESGKTIDYVATCEGCACAFMITTGTKKLIEMDATLDEKLAKSLCPKCRHSGLALDFRCDTEKEECFYVMTCKQCNHTFQEFR